MKKLLVIIAILTWHFAGAQVNDPAGTIGVSSPNVGIGTTTTVANYGVNIRGGLGNAIPQGLYIQRGDIPASNQDNALGILFSSNAFSSVGIGGGSCAFQLFPSVNTPSPDMAFSTNTVAPQLIIKWKTGNVGIGTATPAQLLDVNGTTKTKKFIMSNGAANGFILQSNANGMATWVSPSTLVLTETDPKVGTLTTNKIPKWGGSTLVDSKIAEVGSNIGIGTSTPTTSYGVHIFGGIGDPIAEGLYIQRADAGGSNQDDALAIGFSSNLFTGVGIGGGSCGFILTPSVNTPAPDMAFSTNNAAPQMIIKFSGNVGIGTAAPNHQLELSKDDAAKPFTTMWTVVSDARLKTNVKDFTDGLSVLEKIHPVTFNYNGQAGTQTGIDGIGTIAQELQQVAPYMVKTWKYSEADGKQTDYLAVQYHALLFILTNSVKELAVQNDQLKADNTSLKNDVTEMKNEIAQLQEKVMGTSNIDAKVSSSNQVALSQIAPNPFSQKATITYSLPANTSDAQLLITDENGKVVRIYSIANGSTQQVIDANTFTAGSYQYSLIVNGKMIDSKQMVIIK